MSNRTWVCLDCRRSYRRDQNGADVRCAKCGEPCEYVEWKLHIPSPAKRKEWDAFWTQYLFEKREILRFQADKNVMEVYLPLLNRRLERARPVRKRRAQARRVARSKRRRTR